MQGSWATKQKRGGGSGGRGGHLAVASGWHVVQTSALVDRARGIARSNGWRCRWRQHPCLQCPIKQWRAAWHTHSLPQIQNATQPCVQCACGRARDGAVCRCSWCASMWELMCVDVGESARPKRRRRTSCPVPCVLRAAGDGFLSGPGCFSNA